MNKSEAEVIKNIITRLSGDGANSPEINAMLADRNFRIWCDTWVTGALAILVDEDRSKHDLDLAVRLSR